MRALLAADLVAGRLGDPMPTKKAASLFGISPAYVRLARKLNADEREAVRRGDRPLVQPKQPQSPPVYPRRRPQPHITLVQANPVAEIDHVIARHGTEPVWNRLVAAVS
jgi:hypothetical protein